MSFLRSKLHLVKKCANKTKQRALLKIKHDYTAELIHKYPNALLSNALEGKVVYMLRPESPEQVLDQGGFHALKKNLWIAADVGNSLSRSNNEGMVCFTLLPEITTIFLLNKSNLDQQEHYIYAIPLEGHNVYLGGQWRQIACPGAMPLPEFWRSRKVLDVINDKVVLGSVIGQGEDALVRASGEKYVNYQNNSAIIVPKDISINPDYPAFYDIQDTEMTKRFQEQVEAHYQDILNKPKLSHNQL